MRPFALGCLYASAALAFFPPSQYATAQDWRQQAIPQAERSHDFGSVARAAKTEHRFYIKNTSDKVMHLTGVRASCGCTTPIIETKEIQPGGTGSILAVFNTGSFTGAKSATLTVSLGQPFWTEIQLNVKGYIRSDIVVAPGEANFGEVIQGEGKSIDLAIEYAGRNDWEIKDITSENEFIDVTFEETLRSGGRVKYSVNATVKGDAPVGDLHQQLVIHTNDRNITSVPLRVLANVQPDAVRSTVDVVELGAVEEGDEVVKRFVVKASKPFRILDISSEIAEIGFDPVEDAKPLHLVNIRVKPNQPLGKVVGDILVKTDFNDQPTKLVLNYELLKQTSNIKPAPAYEVPVSTK